MFANKHNQILLLTLRKSELKRRQKSVFIDLMKIFFIEVQRNNISVIQYLHDFSPNYF